MKGFWLGTCVFLLLGSPAWAQDEVSAESEDSAPGERPHIQVLQHPYDLASFYRSSQGSFGYVLPLAGPVPQPAFGVTPREDPYSIAAYYRGEGDGYGYSRYWSQPRSAYPMPWTGRAPAALRCPPGEVSLLLPTFLAAVGPLNDGFFFSSH
jgi:hypothetical protein